VVVVGIGATGWVVSTGGTGAGLVGAALALGVAPALGDWVVALTSPAVAAGVGPFGLPLLTTAAIADPPQHSTRNVPTIPSINGSRDFFAGPGIPYMPECG
jgi:hypothetical protein